MKHFLGVQADPSVAPAAVVVPVPYDGTSTWRKGADQGPAALLEASAHVELYDIETNTEPYRRGIVTRPPLELPPDPEAMAELVERTVDEILASEQLPVLLGGEHSVTIGAVRAAARRYPGLSVLQIDAHGDLRDSYEGSTHNHACVMARAREVASIVQVGVRSIDRSELESVEPGRVFWAHEIQGVDSAWQDRVIEKLTEHVYVTIDLDAFDPALVPATGTPEPGGLDWYQVTGLVAKVARHRRLVGFDVVELLPQAGSHASDFVAAKLVHRVLAEYFVHTPAR